MNRLLVEKNLSVLNQRRGGCTTLIARQLGEQYPACCRVIKTLSVHGYTLVYYGNGDIRIDIHPSSAILPWKHINAILPWKHRHVRHAYSHHPTITSTSAPGSSRCLPPCAVSVFRLLHGFRGDPGSASLCTLIDPSRFRGRSRRGEQYLAYLPVLIIHLPMLWFSTYPKRLGFLSFHRDLLVFISAQLRI
jgi:hypothetical protein